MEREQANLERTAVEFLEAAGAMSRAICGHPDDGDPLDDVDTSFFELDPFDSVIDREELERLKVQLSEQRLLPAAVVELVYLARQMAAMMQSG